MCVCVWGGGRGGFDCFVSPAVLGDWCRSFCVHQHANGEPPRVMSLQFSLEKQEGLGVQSCHNTASPAAQVWPLVTAFHYSRVKGQPVSSQSGGSKQASRKTMAWLVESG